MSTLLLALALLGCAEEPPPVVAPAPAPAPVAAPAEEPVSELAPPPEPPFDRIDDLRDIVVIGHVSSRIAGPKPYRLPDPWTGDDKTVGIPKLEVAEGQRPPIYPAGDGSAWVLFTGTLHGEDTLLEYRIAWDPDKACGDGEEPGGFTVKGAQIFQHPGGEPLARFEWGGTGWSRIPVAKPGAAAGG
jgi:hypothetical protein